MMFNKLLIRWFWVDVTTKAQLCPMNIRYEHEMLGFSDIVKYNFDNLDLALSCRPKNYNEDINRKHWKGDKFKQRLCKLCNDSKFVVNLSEYSKVAH